MNATTKEIPFFLTYKRDAVLPTDIALAIEPNAINMEIFDFKEQIIKCLNEAWSIADQNTEASQITQKSYYDQQN